MGKPFHGNNHCSSITGTDREGERETFRRPQRRKDGLIGMFIFELRWDQ